MSIMLNFEVMIRPSYFTLSRLHLRRKLNQWTTVSSFGQWIVEPEVKRVTGLLLRQWTRWVVCIHNTFSFLDYNWPLWEIRIRFLEWVVRRRRACKVIGDWGGSTVTDKKETKWNKGVRSMSCLVVEIWRGDKYFTCIMLGVGGRKNYLT